MKTETITWHELPADGMPDAETTVLLELRELDGDGTKVQTGWLAQSGWVDINAWPIESGGYSRRFGASRLVAVQ